MRLFWDDAECVQIKERVGLGVWHCGDENGRVRGS